MISLSTSGQKLTCRVESAAGAVDCRIWAEARGRNFGRSHSASAGIFVSGVSPILECVVGAPRSRPEQSPQSV